MLSIKSGESVKIEFNSAENLDATFVIHMLLTNANVQNATELPLSETSPGNYEGYYTATSNMKAEGVSIESYRKRQIRKRNKSHCRWKAVYKWKKAKKIRLLIKNLPAVWGRFFGDGP